MARTRDLWWTSGRRGPRRKTNRHPDNGGDKNAKRYLAVWSDPDGRERTEAFHKKGDADRFGDRMESDKLRGEYIDPGAGKVHVSVLAEKWLSLREVGSSTAIRYESVWRRHVEPTFGSRSVGSVAASDIATWSKSMAAQPGNRYLGLLILTGIFNLAVADKARRDNPARSDIVGRPRPARPEREAWPAARVHRVADGISAAWHDLPLAAAGLGLRDGEVLGLSLDDLDGEAAKVTIRRQVSRHGTFKLPKGGKVREAPLPRGVAALTAQAVPIAVTLPWENEDGSLGDPVTVRLLWTAPGGNALQSWWWHRYVWQPALKAAGLPKAHENGMHALRHFYSTTLLDNGVSLAGVMDFMGHSRESAPLAVGVYGHVTPETWQAARDAVDKVLFRVRPVASNGTLTELAPAR